MSGVTLGTALAGLGLGIYFAFKLFWGVIRWFAEIRINHKAGEAGWKTLVPYLSSYTRFKIAWSKDAAIANLIVLIIYTILTVVVKNNYDNNPTGAMAFIYNIVQLAFYVLEIICNYKLCRAFGKGTGFFIGMIFFESIFLMILGFGASVYLGNDDSVVRKIIR